MSEPVAAILRALIRLSTYANAPASFSAGTALLQLQKALGGVAYVDGGWQTLVDGLAARARGSGVDIVCGVRAETLHASGKGFTVATAAGIEMASRAVVLAVPRAATERILESAGVSRATDAAPAIRMATLDLGLSRIPRPTDRFALGIDQPLYLSVHSGVARLGDRGAVLHVAKYLPASESDPAQDRAEIDQLLDTAQPGWRKELVIERFLPRLTVAERLDTASSGGMAGRPDFRVPELPGVFLAGDWLQGASWLADAAVGSGQNAALAVARRLAGERAVA